MASTAAPAVGCRAPMHGVWLYSTKYGDGVWSTDRRGPRRKICLACGAQMFRRLAAKTAFAWGGPRKKRYFCCARWNMAYYGVWSIGVCLFGSAGGAREYMEYGRPEAGMRPRGTYGVSGPAIRYSLHEASCRCAIFRDIPRCCAMLRDIARYCAIFTDIYRYLPIICDRSRSAEEFLETRPQHCDARMERSTC